MRVFWLFIISLVIACGPASNSKQLATPIETRYSIVWLNQIEEAVQLSKLTGKPLFIYFYNDYCEWCVKTDNEVFNNIYVENIISKKFIALKVDTFISPFAQAANVKIVPSYVIVPAVTVESLDGTDPVYARVGYQDADNLIKFIAFNYSKPLEM